MFEEHLALPIMTTVLGVEVEVVRVGLRDDESIVAICRHGKAQQPIAILDLPLPSPPPVDSEWIDAYRAWLKDQW